MKLKIENGLVLKNNEIQPYKYGKKWFAYFDVKRTDNVYGKELPVYNMEFLNRTDEDNALFEVHSMLSKNTYIRIHFTNKDFEVVDNIYQIVSINKKEIELKLSSWSEMTGHEVKQKKCPKEKALKILDKYNFNNIENTELIKKIFIEFMIKLDTDKFCGNYEVANKAISFINHWDTYTAYFPNVAKVVKAKELSKRKETNYFKSPSFIIDFCNEYSITNKEDFFKEMDKYKTQDEPIIYSNVDNIKEEFINIEDVLKITNNKKEVALMITFKGSK